MKRFYPDFASIERVTQSLPIYQSETQCAHCLKHDQFVSHGRIYKQISMTECQAVGKRLLCSRRYGRTGCGRTVQLRVADSIPHLRYGAQVISTFIALLLDNLSVSRAYQKATGQFETRNAWRWIKKLMAQLGEYRCTFRIRPMATMPARRSRTASLLLPTLAQLRVTMRGSVATLGAIYQLTAQRAFM